MITRIEVQNKNDRINQGDVFSKVEFVEYAIEKEGQIEISKIEFPLIIVLTQDCDLEQDFYNRKGERGKNHDKHLISVIVAPIYNHEHFILGEHLSELKLEMHKFPTKKDNTEGRYIRNNKNPRYHYLEFEDDISLVNSVIDFKHYFTVNLIYLNKLKHSNFVGSIGELYREDISQRFASFLSRVGLPELI